MFAAFIKWFTDRWPFNAVIEWSLEEEIPGGDSFWYSFGATTLFVFIIQVVTGIWQLFFYVPTVDHAYQSVSYLRYQVPFGWFIHGLHYWGSNAFIIIVFVHLLRVFVWSAYKRPRQLTWLVGVILFFLVLALSFTGALLPWDELGYWAAEVGTSIAGTVPAIGFFIKEFMRGGASMDQMTLSRFFIAHVAILPGILAGLIAFHVVAFRQFRSVGPWKEEKRKKIGYFWPQQVLKDLIVISCLFVGLVALSAFWPAQVSGPADDLDNIITPKPEWQFLFLYQFLKLFKGRMEPVGTVGVPLVLFLILFLLPFYDRNEKHSPLHRPIAMLGCIALIVWFLVYTVLGYYSQPGASISQQVTVSAQASESAKEGAKLFSSQGCVACHAVHGEGGNIGPNLSNIGGQGLTDQWLTTQIRHPKEHDPSTAMPAFDSLTDQQVKHLVDFLQSLGGTPSKSEQSQSLPVLSAPPKSPNEPNKPPQKTQASQASLISQGKSLFSLQGCAGCHIVNGKGGSLGPDLSDVGSRGFSEQWLLTQLEDPKKHDADTLMPSFSSLSSQKLDSLVAYLESLKSSSEQAKPSTPFSGPSTSRPPSPPAAKPAPPTGPNSTSVESTAPGPAAYLVGNPPHGKLLYNKHCSDCHGKDGKGGVSNPGSDTGRIPGLSPISQKLFSENPETFAQNIDRYIQHGVRPEGPAPEKTMPAFGDGLKLTQQMICEIEAYILQLNNVNRAKIMHPGVKPYVFFAITLGGCALTVFIIVLLWVPPAEGGKPEQPEPRQPEEAKEPPTPGPDQGKPTPEEDRKPHPTSSAAFVIIVIVVIAIIATMLLLIFSSFVTTKPIPTITAQHIAPKKQQPAGPSFTARLSSAIPTKRSYRTPATNSTAPIATLKPA
jgi:ubiquinol-cytochrome c reductase cytochrome b subunit